MSSTSATKPKRTKVKLPPKGSLVMVYWDDAGDHLEPGWQNAEDVQPVDLLMVSIGIYIGTRKAGSAKNMIIAGTRCLSDESVNTIGQIPLGCVSRVVELIEKPEA